MLFLKRSRNCLYVKKKQYFRYLLLFIFPCISCGNTIPFLDESKLIRPVGLELEVLPGLKFRLKYFVQNQERIFNGYNVYVARNSIGDGEIYGVIKPISLNGALPTLQHYADDFDVTKQRVVDIDVYNDSVNRFEVGITYFFRIAAASRKNLLSIPSNEVSGVAIQ